MGPLQPLLLPGYERCTWAQTVRCPERLGPFGEAGFGVKDGGVALLGGSTNWRNRLPPPGIRCRPEPVAYLVLAEHEQSQWRLAPSSRGSPSR